MSSEEKKSTDTDYADSETLAPGSGATDLSEGSVGPYSVVRVLGQGAMGIVYEAVDSKLDRTVAIKTLPTEFAGDEERIARFKREATLLASFSHPNIATVYSHEELEGQHCLVMEYVEGQGLDDVIANTELSLSEVLQIALEISSALEVAHNHGVVHRDLKPANIRLNSSFSVKVLDFGLAKNIRLGGSGSSVDQAAQTAAGQVIGTPSYMSPEQARGRTVDKRADLWAVGCILFEMLTGERVFGGDNISDTLVNVLQGDPAWSLLPEDVPTPLVKIIERCLQKDIDARQPDAGMIRIELEELIAGKSDGVTAFRTGPTLSRQQKRQRMVYALAFAAVGVIGIIIGSLMNANSDISSGDTQLVNNDLPFHSAIALPTPIELGMESIACWRTTVAISPDGQSIAYSSGLDDDPLFIRDMGGFDYLKVTGTEGAHSPFYSPDSRQIAFLLDDKLCVVSTKGGTVKTLADAEVGAAGVWAADGYIYFPTAEESILWRIPESGGEREKLYSGMFGSATYADELPDGRLIFTEIKTSNYHDYAVTLVFDPSDKSTQRIGILGARVRYCELGYLLYCHSGALYARTFDAENTILGDEEILLSRRVAINGNFGNAQYEVSNNGTVVFADGPRIEQGNLAIMDAKGQLKERFENLPTAAFSRFALSADERFLAVTMASDRDDIWIYDIREKTLRKLTNEGANRDPVWTPDGKEIYYRSSDQESLGLYKISVFGGEREKLAGFDSWYIRPTFGSSATPVLLEVNKAIVDITDVSDLESIDTSTQHVSWGSTISPDGKWVSYVSDRTGEYEVYLGPMPFDPEKGRQVSIDGGLFPSWSSDGKEILFLNKNKFYSVDLGDEISNAIPAPIELFEHDWAVVPGMNYVPYGTEGEFIAVEPAETIESIGTLRIIQDALPQRNKSP